MKISHTLPTGFHPGSVKLSDAISPPTSPTAKSAQAPATDLRAAPQEATLVEAYIAALQAKLLTNKSNLIKVPAETTLGQWLGLYREQLEHPVVKEWMRTQHIDPTTLSVIPTTGVMTAKADGEYKTFSLTDDSGWGQVSGPLLAAGKVIAPVAGQKLRGRFDTPVIEVSATVVTSFHGEPLPAKRADGASQARRLERNKAFDPISPNDRLRPASSRSAQALEQQRQAAATFYLGAPQALAYKKLTVDVSNALPNVRDEAKKWADDLLLKLTKTPIDSDTVFLNRFKEAQSGATATGWEHMREEPSSSLRLPDALLKNFPEHDWIPGNLDLEAGLYKDGTGQSQKGGYGAHNEFPLAPSAVMHKSWNTDFQSQITDKIDQFWKDQGANYQTMLKGEFIRQARQQLKAFESKSPAEQALQAPEHTFTREDYRIVMGAVSNLPLDENAPLTVAQLQEQAPVKGVVRAHAFDINGFKSSDIVRFTAQDDGKYEYLKGRRDGTQILYIPGNVPAFLKFESFEKLDQWVADQGKDAKKREALASHFAKADRQDHDSGSFWKSVLHFVSPLTMLAGEGRPKEGVDTSLKQLGTGARDNLEGTVIDRGNFAIKGDVFSTMKDAAQARMSSDADVVIKSNSEVTRDTWLNDLSAAAGLLAKFAPIAEPAVVGLAAVTGLAETVLGTEKAVSGDTEKERADGGRKTFDGTLNTLFAVVGAKGGAGEDPVVSPREKPSDPVGVVDTPEPQTSPVDEAQPGPSSGSPVGKGSPLPAPTSKPLFPMSPYATPGGEQLIDGVSPDALGVYRIKDSIGLYRQFVRYTDETGISKVFEIESRYRTGATSARIISPQTGRGMMTINPGRGGEWVRAPGDGGGFSWPWKRPASPTGSDTSSTTPKISERFLESDGSKTAGAEKFDDYLNLEENTDYLFNNTLYQDGSAVKRKLTTSWKIDDGKFAVTPGETAVPWEASASQSEYSTSFLPDLTRERYRVITRQEGVEINTELDYTSDSEFEKRLKRVEQFEDAIPDTALRARISEVAHQGSSFPALMELSPPVLKEGYSVAAGNKTFTINYNPASDTHTVIAETNWRLRHETEDGLITSRDMDIKSSRTFTIRRSNELNSDGYEIDKSAPTKMEVSTPTVV